MQDQPGSRHLSNHEQVYRRKNRRSRVERRCELHGLRIRRRWFPRRGTVTRARPRGESGGTGSHRLGPRSPKTPSAASRRRLPGNWPNGRPDLWIRSIRCSSLTRSWSRSVRTDRQPLEFAVVNSIHHQTLTAAHCSWRARRGIVLASGFVKKWVRCSTSDVGLRPSDGTPLPSSGYGPTQESLAANTSPASRFATASSSRARPHSAMATASFGSHGDSAGFPARRSEGLSSRKAAQ
jgi:hypothetical protein